MLPIPTSYSSSFAARIQRRSLIVTPTDHPRVSLNTASLLSVSPAAEIDRPRHMSEELSARVELMVGLFSKMQVFIS